MKLSSKILWNPRDDIEDYNKKNSEMYLRLLKQEQVDHMMSFSMDCW